jgi:hypothetical protein
VQPARIDSISSYAVSSSSGRRSRCDGGGRGLEVQRRGGKCGVQARPEAGAFVYGKPLGRQGSSESRVVGLQVCISSFRSLRSPKVPHNFSL